MNNVLVLKSSILAESSVSSTLADELIQQLNEVNGNRLQVFSRSLDSQSIPHLDENWLGALMTPESDRSDEQQRKVDFSDQLISELQQANTVVITAPMYNFSIPSSLKAWNDHIARAGTTFKYTENGPVGLLTDKKVYLIVTTGGVHEAGVTDFITPYMKFFLGFVGMTDIEVITANGLAMGDESREAGIARAREQINALGEIDRTSQVA